MTSTAIDFDRLPAPILPDRPDLVALYDLAWKLASQHICESHGRRHMDAAWDANRNCQWVWDTCFMALYCRYAHDQFPGVESLDNFYDLQRDDGYIGMTYDMTTHEEPWPDRINPPLFAWVEYEHMRTTGDTSRLARVLPHLQKLTTWIDHNRRTAPHRRLRATDGPTAGRGESTDSFQLYYFRDCGSSGMDDSPRTPRHDDAGQYFDWIDLSSQVALSKWCLAALYKETGDALQAERCIREWELLSQLINDELWSPVTRFYHDRSHPRNFVAHKTIAGFWPILSGVATEAHTKDLIGHLHNPATFDRPIPVPSLAADDLNYDPEGTYWVGGVWAPTNYMVTRGLHKTGYRAEAHRIGLKYLNGLVATFQQMDPHTLWECNSPEMPLPGKQAYTGSWVKPDFVGWSGLGPIATLIEDILGFDVNGLAHEVIWTLHLSETHGITRLPVGGQDLLNATAQARQPGQPAEISLSYTGDTPLSIRIHCDDRMEQVTLAPNQSTTLTV